MSEIVATTSGLIIDSEFESLIPKLADNEYEGLKEDIKNRGCRDPVVVWKGQNIVLDGHHRYRICTELGIPFKIEEYEFPNRTAAKIFMFTNQNSRRNLNPSQLAMLAIDLEALYGEQAKERQGIRTDLGQEINESERGSSAKKAANVMGISPQTVAYAKRVNKNGVPGLANLVRSGKIRVSAAADIADAPTEFQELLVERAIAQIQVGKKPKIDDIIQELNTIPLAQELASKKADVQEMISETKDVPEALNDPQKEVEEDLSTGTSEDANGCLYSDKDLIDLGIDPKIRNSRSLLRDMDAQSVCNPWDGPWVCEKCNGWWESLKMHSKPEYCPVCGKAPIRRATFED